MSEKAVREFPSKSDVSRFAPADLDGIRGVERRAERQCRFINVEVAVVVGDAGVGLVAVRRAEVGVSALHVQQVVGKVVSAERQRALLRRRDAEGRGDPGGLLADGRIVQKRAISAAT